MPYFTESTLPALTFMIICSIAYGANMILKLPFVNMLFFLEQVFKPTGYCYYWVHGVSNVML